MIIRRQNPPIRRRKDGEGEQIGATNLFVRIGQTAEKKKLKLKFSRKN